jgi:hypothetical protein
MICTMLGFVFLWRKFAFSLTTVGEMDHFTETCNSSVRFDFNSIDLLLTVFDCYDI